MNREVVVGFSGGRDSTQAVATLAKMGYTPIALTLEMYRDGAPSTKAIDVAAQMGIELHTYPIYERFERDIIQNFIAEYRAGRTPAPCTRCNPLIKWRSIEEYADSLNIEHIATGHYFAISKYNNLKYVTRPADRRKDQSYYLWGLSQRTLSRALTPMAEQIKSNILAKGESESMGVCFLEGRPYADFIVDRCGELPRGVIRDKSGVIVGEHNGVARYTIGQRRGEGIPVGYSVVEIQGTDNEIIVGKRNELHTMILEIDECNIVDREELLDSDDIEVMVRGIGLNPEGFARAKALPQGYRIELSAPAWAACAGQPVVLYRGDRVIGGGILRRTY